MAFSRIQSAQRSGITATGVVVETDISRGLYLFQIVGLANKSVEESRERVISALRNSLNVSPKSQNHKIVVSLSPAALRKEGPYFDMAIAVGYMVASGMLSFDATRKVFVGEIGLNGDLRPVQGLLAIAQWAQKCGMRELYAPHGNRIEAGLVEGLTIFLVPTLAALASHLQGKDSLQRAGRLRLRSRSRVAAIDLGDIRGQAVAKRALAIAAAGGHNIVLCGPPGTGKTMLARAFHDILPPLSSQHFLEVATIYSSIGLVSEVLDMTAPFRDPHHTASRISVIGGGRAARPGDITLAHRGVLYLDEFPEFDSDIIEALREPMEEGSISIARATGSVRFPSQFILLASMNPCPCGYRGSTVRTCTCSGADIARYRKKLSGPIMDRIDLWVSVQHIEYSMLHEEKKEKESPSVQDDIQALRDAQYRRAGKLNGAYSAEEVRAFSKLSPAAKKQLQGAAEQLKLSPRSYLRAIKVARTIADLDRSEDIDERHVLEALQYRPRME